MRIKFTGYMDIASKDVPNDAGSIGHWLANLITEAVESESADELFDKLQMSWVIDKA
jgi:hypothetical protein